MKTKSGRSTLSQHKIIEESKKKRGLKKLALSTTATLLPRKMAAVVENRAGYAKY